VRRKIRQAEFDGDGTPVRTLTKKSSPFRRLTATAGKGGSLLMAIVEALRIERKMKRHAEEPFSDEGPSVQTPQVMLGR
jgi:hypothetical protein